MTTFLLRRVDHGSTLRYNLISKCVGHLGDFPPGTYFRGTEFLVVSERFDGNGGIPNRSRVGSKVGAGRSPPCGFIVSRGKD